MICATNNSPVIPVASLRPRLLAGGRHRGTVRYDDRPATLTTIHEAPADALLVVAVVAGCVASTPLRESPPGALRLLPAEPAASVLYVALGDSTVEGVGASSPARNYVGQPLTAQRGLSPRAGGEPRGRGRHGLRSTEPALPRAIKLRPDLVTLSVGPNDITGKRDLESYARDVDAILGILTRQTGAVVVVNPIPDLTVTPRFRGTEIEARVRERVVAFNEILALQARGYGAESWTSTPRASTKCRPARISSGPTAIIPRTMGTRAGPN